MMHRLGLVRALLVDQRQNGRQGTAQVVHHLRDGVAIGRGRRELRRFGCRRGRLWDSLGAAKARARETPTRQRTTQPSMNTTAIAGDPAGVTRRAMISVSTTAVQKTARRNAARPR